MVDSSVLDRKELQRLADRIATAQGASHSPDKTQKANGKGEK
jgi:hypothetical protein